MLTAKNIITYLRWGYVASLALILAVSGWYYNSARKLNSEMVYIGKVIQQISLLDQMMSEMSDRAKRIETTFDAKSVFSLRTALISHSEQANDQFKTVMKLWDKLNPQIIKVVYSKPDFMSEGDPFRHYKQIFEIDKIATSENVSAIKWASSSIQINYSTFTGPANRYVARVLYDSIAHLSNNFGRLIDWFLQTMLAIAVALGLALFFPLERSVARIIEDLSRLKVLAENADRAKSEFLANMSHEIRTPMNGVMGMAELLETTKLDSKQKMFVDVIIKSGSSLVTIINDILDFSKIDAGQLKLDPRPFNLPEAIEDVAALVAASVDEKDLELIVRVQPGLPTTYMGDAGRIRQIVTNIVGNAIKFTQSGHVLVDVSGDVAPEKDGQHIANLVISVTDTGLGIPEDKLEAIFDKFSQVDSSATRKFEGTGLGLSITRMLVGLMGGEITATSELNKGSTFRVAFSLPVRGDLVQRYAIPQDVSGAHILIVDDNEVNRSILMEQLAAWNFKSAEVANGMDALAALHRSNSNEDPFDLIVVDYQMPEMDGIEVVNQIRSQPGIQSTPVIMLTSVDNAGEENIRTLDIQGHLVKPARSQYLLDVIVEALNNRLNPEINARDENRDGLVKDINSLAQYKGTGT